MISSHLSDIRLGSLVILQTAAPAGFHAFYFVPLSRLEIIYLSWCPLRRKPYPLGPRKSHTTPRNHTKMKDLEESKSAFVNKCRQCLASFCQRDNRQVQVSMLVRN